MLVLDLVLVLDPPLGGGHSGKRFEDDDEDEIEDERSTDGLPQVRG